MVKRTARERTLGSRIPGPIWLAASVGWLLCSWPFGGAAEESKPPAAPPAFVTCAACHGSIGEGMESTHAPRLAGQDPIYLRLQIAAFRNRTRPPDPTQEHSLLMTALVGQLGQPELDRALDSIARFPINDPPDRLTGNRERGADLYGQFCSVCHGNRAEGDSVHNMARLNHQHGWYLLRQLQRYRSGERGGPTSDSGAQAMQFYANLLPDEQALLDVVAFIGHARLFGSPELPKTPPKKGQSNYPAEQPSKKGQ